ncbi:MAG: hypothetical protein AAF715_24090 [Myxococcota bacterium]
MKTWRWLMTMGAIGSLAAACTITTSDGDDDGRTTLGFDDDDGSGGGAGVGGAGGTTGVTSGTGGGAPSACLIPGDRVTLAGSQAQSGLDLCTDGQLDGYNAECLPDTSSTACTTFEDANLGCVVDCLYAEPPATHYPVLIPDNIGTAQGDIINFTTCEAIVQGLPQCAGPATDLSLCAFSVCDTCSSEDFGACAAEAQEAGGPCADIVVDAECDPVLNPVTPSPACDGADTAAQLKAVATVTCGPPPT